MIFFQYLFPSVLLYMTYFMCIIYKFLSIHMPYFIFMQTKSF